MVNTSSIARAIALFAPAVLAATSFSDAEFFQRRDKDGGLDLVTQWSPIWFFGKGQGRVPCYPESALMRQDGSPDDVGAFQRPAGGLCAWPNVGCNCRNPGVDIGNPGPAFEVYYSVKQCNDQELRIQYNTFYTKDGWNVGGHGWDWEWVVVVVKRGGDGRWAPSRIVLEQHGDPHSIDWAKIQNTVDDPNSGKNNQGQSNKDHAKIYVGWAKHALFDTRNTGWNDPVSQYGGSNTGRNWRSQDWWRNPDRSDYKNSNPGTPTGNALAKFNGKWGSADHPPSKVHDDMCTY